MFIDAVKIFAPATIAFFAGLAITPILTHYLYKHQMWKKKAGKDVFKETNKKDPMLHVKRAEMYRMGSCDYVITS